MITNLHTPSMSEMVAFCKASTTYAWNEHDRDACLDLARSAGGTSIPAIVQCAIIIHMRIERARNTPVGVVCKPCLRKLGFPVPIPFKDLPIGARFEFASLSFKGTKTGARTYTYDTHGEKTKGRVGTVKVDVFPL